MSTWRPKTIGNAVEEAGKLYAGREFLIVEDRRISYGELVQRVDRFSGGLLDIGIKPGDKVAVWLPNGIEWVVAVFSLARIGAVFVPVNNRFKTEEAEYILKQSDSSALIMIDSFQKTDYLKMAGELCPDLFTGEPGHLSSSRVPGLKTVICVSEKNYPGAFSFDELLDKRKGIDLQIAADAVNPHQTVSILYTSGSTAFPKGVMLTHNNILRNGFEIGERLGLTEEDRYFNPCPYYHNAGLVDGLLAALTHGSCNVTLPAFHAGESLKIMERERCTAIGGIQTMFAKIMEEPSFRRERLSLKAGWTTGPPQTVRDIYERMGVAGITNLYGISEASPCCSISDCRHDPLEDRINRMGKPLPGVEMKIIKSLSENSIPPFVKGGEGKFSQGVPMQIPLCPPFSKGDLKATNYLKISSNSSTGEIVPPGEKGEICVRGWNLMQGYYKNSEETAKAVDADGWLHTGDLGFIDSRGLVFFIGRIKNVIRSGGENISPEEVEGFIYRHPKVKQAEVIGLPDEKWGQRVVACVELKEGMEASPEEIIHFCKERIANFKVPKEVRFVTDWPMTGSGKVQKFKLVERFIDKAEKK